MQKEWQVMKQAPGASFFAILFFTLILTGLSTIAVYWFFHENLAMKNDLIKSLEAKLKLTPTDKAQEILDTQKNINHFVKWGTTSGHAVKYKQLGIIVNGIGLLHEKDDYKIAVVALQYGGLVDSLDATGLQKSSLFDIRKGKIQIKIPVDDKFIEGIKNGQRGTNYKLLLIPNGIKISQFNTLREATALGIKQITIVVGPP